MKQRCTRLIALLLCALLLLPQLAGCAQLEAYRYFFTGEGTKDPAEGALVPPPTTEALSSLTIGYDESYTVEGHFLSLEDVATSDRFLVYVDEEKATETTFTLRAVGVGTGTLVYEWNGEEKRIPITVEPARLAVFFLLGDSDARGTREEDSMLLRAADGLVYYTFPEYSKRFTPATVDDYVVEWLTENEVSKTYMSLLCRTNELTTAGRGRYAGLSAPLAYKWTEQTGEHVWIINLAQENTSIRDLLPDAVTYDGSANDYTCLEAIFASVADTLTREYDAGHYTHARTGWFLAPGGMDTSMSASDYLAALETLSSTMKETLTFTYAPAGSGASAQAYEPTFGGLIGSRAYRTKDLTMAEMTGPRTAQLYAAGMGGSLAETYLLTDMASLWYSDIAVAAYFAKYDRHKYLLYYGYQLPATMADLINQDGSYTAMALNEQAAVAVENLLYLTGLRRAPEGVRASLSLLAYNGRETVDDLLILSYGKDTVAAVPSVSPLWMAKACAATVTLETDVEGATVDLCRLRGLGDGDAATLRFAGNNVGETETEMYVRRRLQFAFSDYPANVYKSANGRLELYGYSQFFTCGYIEQATGEYTVYPTAQYQSGWLYDGKNIWSGHGGMDTVNGYRFGPIPGWDSAYAFLVPDEGTATISFNTLLRGECNSLFAICLNGKMVWPKQAENAVNSANFYTVTPATTVEQLNEAVASLSLAVKRGDTITFISRRANNNEVAEEAIHAVVTIE